MRKTFINLTNHPSKSWGEKQYTAAEVYGEIIDMPFPAIPVDMKDDEMDKLVSEYSAEILSYGAPVVLLQGEFIFTYRLVTVLKENNIKVLSSRSERKTVEKTNPDGTTEKVSIFAFEGFFEY